MLFIFCATFIEIGSGWWFRSIASRVKVCGTPIIRTRYNWCTRGYSKPHAFRHMGLNHACLPVPALVHINESLSIYAHNLHACLSPSFVTTRNCPSFSSTSGNQPSRLKLSFFIRSIRLSNKSPAYLSPWVLVVNGSQAIAKFATLFDTGLEPVTSHRVAAGAHSSWANQRYKVALS